MTNPAQFLFDECIGKPAMLQLKKIVTSDTTFAHVCDYFSQGTPDNVWVPKIAEEGNWIVISGDAGRNPSKGGKLPRLCREHKITHVILTSTLHEKPTAEKIGALAMMWKEIEATVESPPGSRFKLRYKTFKRGAIRLVLQKDEEK